MQFQKPISRNIGMLTKLKHFVPENILYSLYCTLILPYINYSVLILGNACKIYLDKMFKLQKWAIRTISNSHYRATPDLCSQNFMFLMYMVYLSSILVYLCTNITLISFHQFFSTNFTKHVQTDNYYPTRNAQDYINNKTKKVFSHCGIRNCRPSFWNSLDKKRLQDHQTLPKSAEISFTIWIQVILFWGMSRVLFCILSDCI